MEVMMSGRANKCPFTATQWQELENQALIFKYMATGHPIPPDVILHIRRSILLDSCSGSLFPLQPNIGWGCFQIGFGRKAEDPEPGRCRRTDGKKWRCSKEAHPDSKYCERHMHRGKNRSRKPVEMSANKTQSSTNTSSNSSSNPSSFISMAANETRRPMYSSCSRPPPVMGLSPQPNPTRYHLDSESLPDVRDYRSFHGLKEGASQFSSFPEPNGTGKDGSWTFTPLVTSSLGETKHQNSYYGTDMSKQGINEEKEQHQSIAFGTDFKLGRDAHEESEKPIRHFFNEWPQKSKEAWMGLEEDQSVSKTQLSISIPWGHHHHHQEFHSSLDNSQSETGH